MSEYTSKEIAKLACEALADKKADDIKVIDISEVSSLADYFVIAGGMNRNQVQAMADNVEETLGKKTQSLCQTGRGLHDGKLDSHGLQRRSHPHL